MKCIECEEKEAVICIKCYNKNREVVGKTVTTKPPEKEKEKPKFKEFIGKLAKGFGNMGEYK